MIRLFNFSYNRCWIYTCRLLWESLTIRWKCCYILVLPIWHSCLFCAFEKEIVLRWEFYLVNFRKRLKQKLYQGYTLCCIWLILFILIKLRCPMWFQTSTFCYQHQEVDYLHCWGSAFYDLNIANGSLSLLTGLFDKIMITFEIINTQGSSSSVDFR